MIRQYSLTDIEVVLDIWLKTSTKAHDFVAADFWASQVDNMRNIYIPASETYVYEIDSQIVAFCSLYEHTLAAIFVAPEFQGRGIGTQLLNHAKDQRTSLILSVYKQNKPSFNFYQSQGFVVVIEQVDEHTGEQEYMMKFE